MVTHREREGPSYCDRRKWKYVPTDTENLPFFDWNGEGSVGAVLACGLPASRFAGRRGHDSFHQNDENPVQSRIVDLFTRHSTHPILSTPQPR
jgi:hypothetical protein